MALCRLVRRPLLAGTLTASALAVVLSGCGVADQGVRPGTAAQVGEERITLAEVDDVADGACAYLDAAAAPGGEEAAPVTARPRALVRQQITKQLIEQAAVRQLLDDAGLEPGPEYTQTIGQIETSLTDLPKDQADALLTADGSLAYVQAGLGRLVIEGGTPVEQGDQLAAESDALLAAWLSENDVEINPVYRLRVEDGVLVPTDDELSAAAGAAAPPASITDDPESAAASTEGLSDDEVCG